MPGIAGLITKMPSAWAEEQLSRMMQPLLHGGFYSSGIWSDAGLGVYVGWTTRENRGYPTMPLRNEREDIFVIFSGEEFADESTALQLKQRGHEFNRIGLNYLVHLYEESEEVFLANLNGWFHGILLDKRRGDSVLFNDRFGMHRLYYHESDQALYFAAESKAILGIRPDLASIDAESLGEFISCGSVLRNRTLFKDIRIMPPASAWRFRNAALERKGTYFEAKEWECQESLPTELFYDEVRQTFARILPRYFKESQGIAMSLTGGLDTRMIMAWHQHKPDSLPCYTFGGSRRDCRDVTVARKIADACGQPHKVIPVGSEFLSRFDDYANRTVYLSDGCVDVGRSPDLYLNELAREIAPVRMTGNFGGEVLRGVRAFKVADPMPGLFSRDLIPSFRRAVETYTGFVDMHPVSFAAFKQCPWHHFGVLALEQSQLSIRSPFLDNDFVRTLFRAPQVTFKSEEVSVRLIADGNPKLLRIPTDRGLIGGRPRILSALSRSILALQFKAEYAYDLGMPQWVATADHLLSPLRLDRLFLGRHKIFHFRIWYRDALGKYVQEMLLDSRSLARAYIDRRVVEGLVRAHVKGHGNYTAEIHKLITLEILHRQFVDNSSSRHVRNNPVSGATIGPPWRGS